MNIPNGLQGKYKEIESMIVKFCNEKLNAEYRNICIRLLQKIYRRNPSSLLDGPSQIWAAGIVYAIGAANFIFEKNQDIHMSGEEIASPFGISAGIASAKAAELRNMFEIDYSNPEWLLQKIFENNPMTWMVEVDGNIVDIRNMSLEVQREAFELGVIPYVPGDRVGFTDKKGIDRVVIVKDGRNLPINKQEIK